MIELWARLRNLPTLEDRFSSRHNAFGFLRLAMAGAVLVGHSWELGAGHPRFLGSLTAQQTNLPHIAVYGFFVMSGFLIAGSGLKTSLPRYAWHRFLRIFPGLWACLAVTALVLAPLVALYERGTLDGFWRRPDGPGAYLANNWTGSARQYGISGLLADVPFASAFNGSLWTLRYELACYVLIGVLLATAVLRQAPRLVLVLTAGAYALIVSDFAQASAWTTRPPARGWVGPFPLIGSFGLDYMIYLGFLFLAGAAARLYLHRIPMHGAVAAAAAVALLASMRFGGFIVIGMPAFAYLMLYAAVALPAWFQGIGRRRDYSYGIYIYAFPIQQVIALIGGARYGVGTYLLLSAVGTVVMAAASWHLVEHPAMTLKDYSPRWVGRRRVPAQRPAVDRLVDERQPLETV